MKRFDSDYIDASKSAALTKCSTDIFDRRVNAALKYACTFCDHEPQEVTIGQDSFADEEQEEESGSDLPTQGDRRFAFRRHIFMPRRLFQSL